MDPDDDDEEEEEEEAVKLPRERNPDRFHRGLT